MAASPDSPPDDGYGCLLADAIATDNTSFENPNYQLGATLASYIDPTILDDHLNSNMVTESSVFHELCEVNKKGEADDGDEDEGGGDSVGGRRSSASSSVCSGSSANKVASNKRRVYAAIDVSAMGVDVDVGPRTALDNKVVEEKSRRLSEELHDPEIPKNDEPERESEKLEESDKEKKLDGGEDTFEAQVSKAVIQRRKRDESQTSLKDHELQSLPSGWEEHSDEQGPYYWHIKSGDIQRERPVAGVKDNTSVVRDVRSSKIFDEDFDPLTELEMKSSMPKSCTTNSIAHLAKNDLQQQRKGDFPGLGQRQATMGPTSEWKRHSMPPKADLTGLPSSDRDDIMCIPVLSLGSIQLREDELTPENSSKSVNRCIVQLSSAFHEDESMFALKEYKGNIGCRLKSGMDGGRLLKLELQDGCLRLVSPFTGATLTAQPIHSIRVWGVGRDCARDFAYVARDRSSCKHLCHVFRCQIPARTVANALRDICKKVLIERSLSHSSSRLLSSGSSVRSTLVARANEKEKGVSSSTTKSRPTSLKSSPSSKLQTRTVPIPESFPTPMEEPRKVLKGFFLGITQVDKPCGIDVVHGAIEKLMNDGRPRSEWSPASVAVAPSTVTISFSSGKPAIECRVRFLSFLGKFFAYQKVAIFNFSL